MFLKLCTDALSTTPLSVTALFAMGALGSVSHCSMMCSPFAAMFIGTAPHGTENPVPSALKRLMPYHAGRILTYSFLGAVGATVAAGASALHQGLGQFLAAFFLTLAALLLLAALWPRLGTTWPNLPTLPVPQQWISALLANPSGFGRLALGALLGFMPCALVYAALLTASASGQPVTAALSMFAFGLGTVPALMGAGAGFSVFRRRWPQLASVATTVLLLINGFGLLAVAGNLVFQGV